MGDEVTFDLAAAVDAAIEDYEKWWLGVDLELLGVIERYPGHTDPRGVFAKVTMVNRLYMTGLERHSTSRDVDALAPAARVAVCLTKHAEELDGRIARLRTLVDLSPSSLAQIVDTHGWLVGTVKSAGVGRTVSFSSKYLHFHAPMVPIYDSVACGALERFSASELGSSFRVTDDLVPATEMWCTDYKWLVARFAELHRRVQHADCRPGTTVKQLDHMLWGRQPWSKAGA
jgi:hypothetical protein